MLLNDQVIYPVFKTIDLILEECMQIHCIVDSISSILLSTNKVDHRPLYFGLWDVPVYKNPDGMLTYFSKGNPRGIWKLDIFKNLYGQPITITSNTVADKMKRYFLLKESLKSKGTHTHIVSQVDLFYMDYCKSCYSIKHRPHFVVIKDMYKNGFWVQDLHFDWEGFVHEDNIINSFHNDHTIFYQFNSSNLSEPSVAEIAHTFEQSVNWNNNNLVSEIRTLIEHCSSSTSTNKYKTFAFALSEIGVITSRKKSYAPVLSYFSDLSELYLEETETEVKKLVNGWSSFALHALKLGILGKEEIFHKLKIKLDVLAHEEQIIQEKLKKVYIYWKDQEIKSWK
jgi:hypothetical protein